jgi:glutaminyl-tRNA synthetase
MSEPEAVSTIESGSGNFVRDIVEDDLRTARTEGRVATRFPPEPNGYLHIGHAKSICLNFGLAERFGGTCNLRLDDTNPLAESEEYVRSIIEDVCWLGFDFGDRLYFASDYFQQIYDWAEQLVSEGKAYVDDRGLEEIRSSRGNFYAVGEESFYRNRSVSENMDLLRRMKSGEFGDGERVLRAKIDMSSSNQNMRDPVMYRIRHASHHRTGDTWCLYPMYDWAHGLCDAIERITHSICTLEFEDHRPLYDWFLVELEIVGPKKPQQIEFARMNLTYTMLSKRRLQQLVEEKIVSGWDDPRMPTLAGMRRRGFTPQAIRRFCDYIGVSKRESMVDVQLLEFFQREDLNEHCRRVMGVLRPLKLTLVNWPVGRVQDVELLNHPEYPERGMRRVPFCDSLYVEEDDFREVAPPKWYRLTPGQEVRLRGACLVTCNEVVKDASGRVVELRCTYDPNSWGGQAPDGRRVKGTLHWVSAEHSVDAEVRLYDRLFSAENPMSAPDGVDWRTLVNPQSLEVCTRAKLEPSLRDTPVLDSFQLERLGYFCVDRDTNAQRVVLNRTLSLKDAWAKLEKKLRTD